MSGSALRVPRRPTLSRAVRLFLLAIPLSLGMAAAQAQTLGGVNLGDADQPIEIEASKAIEWHRDEKVYIARGDARITRGDFVLNAEIVTAHYRETKGQDPRIWRVEAEGAVRVTTPTATVTGDHAVYDLDKGVVVMVGDDLRVKTAKETLTADDSLEYWEDRQMVVARGNAVVVQEGRRLRADLLTGHFEQTPEGERKLVRVEAAGDVRLSTESEFARGDKGTYDLETEIATLEGSVKITRGENQLNGERAEVNLQTGISRLLGDGGDSRVRTLIVPSSKPETPKSEAPKPEANAQ